MNNEKIIEKARQEFSLKQFEKALELYKNIPTEILTELDQRIIEFCEVKMNKKSD